MLYSFEDKEPKLLGNNYFIAESATVIGAVIIHNNVIILPNAVIRADNAIIEIGENTNIQDGAVLHTDPDCSMKIGKDITIGHNAVFHGKSIGDNSVIAIGAVVLSNAVIGRNCLIGANALVLENQEIPDGSLVIGTGRIKSKLTKNQIENLKKYSRHYLEKIARYQKGIKLFKNNNYYALKDLNLKYIRCSESVAEEAGLDPAKSIKGKNDHEMLWGALAESFIKTDNELILSNTIKINTLEMIQCSPGIHKVLVSKTGLRKNNGNLVAIITTNIIIDDIDVDIRKKTGKLSNDEQKFYLGAAWGEKYITKREVQVLKCILHGFSSTKIASLLKLSKKRIECIIKQLKQKLQCRSQLEIVSRAIIEGWIYLLEEDLQIDTLSKNKNIKKTN